MKYAIDIVNEMNERGPIEVPKGYFASEDFDLWMYEGNDKKENYQMIWNDEVNFGCCSMESSYKDDFGDAA